LTVNVSNQGHHDDTVHWHGLRLDNRYDGTHETQTPIAVGDSFAYQLEFPDPGVYWYHPHVREDYGQELGLYGNVLVVPDEAELPQMWHEAARHRSPNHVQLPHAPRGGQRRAGTLPAMRDEDPFHIHGAGRFLILARDEIAEPNLAWKDTVLVRTGETVDILLEVTNPGLWMAHCHIAEHHESGMMFSFRDDPRPALD
jgi:FtsP/CotA-like multicopper oxidase with cupredoxin domain